MVHKRVGAGGYYGRYLKIDVSTGQADWIPIDERALRAYLGGCGLGTYLLQELESARFDALADEAALAFVFSPLVGSPLTTSAKFAVVAKSPLTERLNDSLASSQFAITGKQCGCDAIVIVGRATEPSVVLIDDGQVRVVPAGAAWGEEIPASEQCLQETHGPAWQWAVIGPAGEHRVRYATISHDGRHAGRGGSGAVLGAKRIKAIGVRGSQRASWAHPRELVALSKQLSRDSFGPATAKYRELGTATNLLTFNRLHALPTRNFQQGSFDGAAALSPEQLSVTRAKTRTSCACCTIGCEHLYSLRPINQPDGGNSEQASGSVRLEYENLFALGPLCGIDDADTVLRASQRCDALGLDTISTGGTLAFAMECVERGLLDQPWLTFGSGPALLSAIEQTARRTGFGNELAEGSRRLAQAVGHNTIAFAAQVKGLEMPGYEPRALQTMALGFAVGTRGADHNRSGAYEVDFSDRVDRRNVRRDAVQLAIESEDRAAIMDSAILCKFLRGVLGNFYDDVAEMLQLVTGWDMTGDELRAAARRIVMAKKRFNIAAGWSPAEDTLPDRFLTDPLPDDPLARLSRDQLQELIVEYNQQRGWSRAGWIPADA